MLCMRAAAAASIPTRFLTFPHRRISTVHLHKPSTIKMSTSSPSQIIEHIVLLKVKPSTPQSSISTMLTNLNNLITLDPVLHISAAPILTSTSKSSSLTFTHMLHSRHASKSDLTSYAEHPVHVGVVANNIKPIVDDVMAVDWIADDLKVGVPPGKKVRVRVVKVKEGLEVGGVVSGIKERFRKVGIEEFTVGENFSPARAKGFSIGSIAILKEEGGGVEEGLDLGMEEFVDDVLVVDYVTPIAAVTAAKSTANL